MGENFTHDVFLSHSSEDKDTVRQVAERLREDGLSVWFDEWEIEPGDSIFSKIEEGLEGSKFIVLFMSEHAFGSEWATLEQHTIRFRDPQNKERRLIPLKLDDTEPKRTLQQLFYIDWQKDLEGAYQQLLRSCGRGPEEEVTSSGLTEQQKKDFENYIRVLGIGHTNSVHAVAYSPGGTHALSGSEDKTVRVWDVASGTCVKVLEGHVDSVLSVAWSPGGGHALSGSSDKTVRVWDVASGTCVKVLKGHLDRVWSVAWSPGGEHALSGSEDKTVRVWDVASGTCVKVLEGHVDSVWSVAWSPGGEHVLTGSFDKTVRVWDVVAGSYVKVLEGHVSSVWSVAWSPGGEHALSGSEDKTVRVWDVASGTCVKVLEGHLDRVLSVAWSPGGEHVLSGADDRTVRVWDVASGSCMKVMEGHAGSVRSVAWGPGGEHALSGSSDKAVRVWNVALGSCVKVLEGHAERVLSVGFISDGLGRGRLFSAAWNGVIRVWDLGDGFLAEREESLSYTNAKVLLVGNSGAGKTGLSTRLVHGTFEKTESTVGAWATQWKLESTTENGVEREIWLWDFGGQADQRLIHQLYMEETQVAVLVFDPQEEKLFEVLSIWIRDLEHATKGNFQKLLVAGRVDAGGLRHVSRERVEDFAKEHDFSSPFLLETSAKEDTGIEELKESIAENIPWDELTQRSSPALFRRLKKEILLLKDQGRVLMRFNELRELLHLRVGEDFEFSDQELSAVIDLLTGPGVVWKLGFHTWILLQPERINSYAQAVIRTIGEERQGLGCIKEERVRDADLSFPSDLQRLTAEEEPIILQEMLRSLIERRLCYPHDTEEGRMLVFPSYARQERPTKPDAPEVMVSYRFEGFLDEIYATLVVALHHVAAFETDELWADAADFRTATKKRLGIMLSRQGSGKAELVVHFDPQIPEDTQVTFSHYVDQHLRSRARDYAQGVERLRHWVCPRCSTPVMNRDVAMNRLKEKGKKASIICVSCEKRVKLWDTLEEKFADPKIREEVRQLEEEAKRKVSSEGMERVLVGEVTSTVGLAGQIFRELTVSDHGIDGEIEFKNTQNQATGKRVYLQLKSGDSHVRLRKSDGQWMFDIKKDRWVECWRDQPFPVILIVRARWGKEEKELRGEEENYEMKWMDVREAIRERLKDGDETIRSVEFNGKRFDAQTVLEWQRESLD